MVIVVMRSGQSPNEGTNQEDEATKRGDFPQSNIPCDVLELEQKNEATYSKLLRERGCHRETFSVVYQG
jgi:hypothetical protein